MSCRAILAGAVHKAAVARTSAKGNSFATLTIRETSIEPARFFSTIVFGAAAAEVLKLAAGDPVAVAGDVDAEIYARDGEHRVSWKFAADTVLSVRKPKRGDRANG